MRGETTLDVISDEPAAEPRRRRIAVGLALVCALILLVPSGARAWQRWGPVRMRADLRLLTVDDADRGRDAALSGLPDDLRTVRGPWRWHVLRGRVELPARLEQGDGCQWQLVVEHPRSWQWQAVGRGVTGGSSGAYNLAVDGRAGRARGDTDGRVESGLGTALSARSGQRTLVSAWSEPMAVAPTRPDMVRAWLVAGCDDHARAVMRVPVRFTPAA